jgi:Tfp pilus assembly protein FimT
LGGIGDAGENQKMKLQRTTRGGKGFTLTELLVVNRLVIP